MQITSIKFVGALVLGMMATSAVAAPAGAGSDVFITTDTIDSASVTSAMAAVEGPQAARVAQTDMTVCELMNTMKIVQGGDLGISEGGVLRSYTVNGSVLDYRQLRNAQLMAATYVLPQAMRQDADKIREAMANVDGYDVTDPKQLWKTDNPPDPTTHGKELECMNSSGHGCLMKPSEHSINPGEQFIDPSRDIVNKLDARVPAPAATSPPPIMWTCTGMICPRNNHQYCRRLGCDWCSFIIPGAYNGCW